MTITHVTDANFQDEVLNEKDKAVLVDFWAEWCGPCRMLAPVIEAMDKKYEGSLKVCKLDTDANPEIAQKYQITGIPCCIVFKNGEEASRIVGYRSESAMESDLSQYIKISS